MEWMKKLDQLNESISSVSKIGSSVFHVALNNISINEQIEIVNWFKSGGVWNSWEAPTSKKLDPVCFHHLLVKGNIEANIGASYYYPPNCKETRKDVFLRNSKNITNLEREDGSLLLYSLNVIPYEHKSLDNLNPYLQEINSLVLSSMLKLKR